MAPTRTSAMPPPGLGFDASVGFYRCLLVVYPRSFRDRYGIQMVQAFGERCQEVLGRRGAAGLVMLWMSALKDLFVNGLSERLAPAALRVRLHRGGPGRTPEGGDDPQRGLVSRAGRVLETVLQDLRYALRGLLHSPGFTLAAALSLALGIGVNSTIFSAVNALLLRPLPVEESERLVNIYTTTDDFAFGGFSYPDYIDVRDRATAFSGLAIHGNTIATLKHGDVAEIVFGELVSGNYFDVLGVRPQHGRTFLREEDEVPGRDPVVVVGHGLWRRRLGSDPAVVGTEIRINGESFTVVGVAPASFAGTVPLITPDFWVPTMMDRQLALGGIMTQRTESRGTRSLAVVGRLAPGEELEQAKAQVDTVMAALAAEYPESNEGRRGQLIPTNEVRLHPDLDGPIFPVAGGLMILVGAVLLIACANVASMLLARASARRREISIRQAIGAGRLRLVGQLLTESVTLSLIGGSLGLLMALWTTRALRAIEFPVPIAMGVDVSVDARVLIFTLGASLLTGVVFGLAPALQASRADLVEGLKEGGSLYPGSRRRFNLRSTLVAGQVALSLVLLVAAALFARSLQNAQQIEPGFDIDTVALLTVNLEMQGYTADEADVFLQDLTERARGIGGINAVTLTDRVPLGFTQIADQVTVEGFVPEEGEESEQAADSVLIDGDYFETFGIPILEGRSIAAEEVLAARPVAVVNEVFARRYWPNGGALRGRISLEGDTGPWLDVIGISGNYKIRTIGEEMRPTVHVLDRDLMIPFWNVVIRADDPHRALDAMRREVRAMDPNLAIFDSRTMSEFLGLALFPVRFGAAMLGIFGILALGLAAVGLYGVIAFTVSRRTHEIGVRMALGAERRGVLTMVVRQGMRLALIGAAIGLGLSLLLSSAMSGLLYGITVLDPVAFLGAAGALLLVALVANLLPARRASRVDPIRALRVE